MAKTESKIDKRASKLKVLFWTVLNVLLGWFKEDLAEEKKKQEVAAEEEKVKAQLEK